MKKNIIVIAFLMMCVHTAYADNMGLADTSVTMKKVAFELYKNLTNNPHMTEDSDYEALRTNVPTSFLDVFIQYDNGDEIVKRFQIENIFSMHLDRATMDAILGELDTNEEVKLSQLMALIEALHTMDNSQDDVLQSYTKKTDDLFTYTEGNKHSFSNELSSEGNSVYQNNISGE